MFLNWKEKYLDSNININKCYRCSYWSLFNVNN